MEFEIEMKCVDTIRYDMIRYKPKQTTGAERSGSFPLGANAMQCNANTLPFPVHYPTPYLYIHQTLQNSKTRHFIWNGYITSPSFYI